MLRAMTVTVPPYTDLLWPALQAVIAVGYAGLKVQGSYGKSWLIESNYIPSGYVAVVASGGPGSPDNPVAVREHPNAQYRGLRAIPGKGPYSLQESFAARGIGVGVPHRGAAAVTQVTTGSTCTDAHGAELTLSQFTPPNAEDRIRQA